MRSIWSIFFILSVLLSVACTRPQQDLFQERPVQSPDFIKGLGQNKNSESVREVIVEGGKTLEILKESYADDPDVNYFAKALMIYNFAKKQGLDKVKLNLANQLSTVYQQEQNTSHAKFSDTPYAEMFIATAKPQFLKETANLTTLFEKQKNIVLNSLHAASAKYALPQGSITLSGSIKYMADYMREFERIIKTSKDINPQVRDEIIGGLYQRFWLKLPDSQKNLSKYENAQELDVAVKELIAFMESFEMTLTEEERAKLTEAESIGQNLNKELSAKETLSLIISIWESMGEQERLDTFGKFTPELHEYLSDKSEKSRACLKKSKCYKLTLYLARKLFIIPEIKKFGIENVQTQIQTAAFEELNAQVSVAALAALKDIPSRLYNEISAELDTRFNEYMYMRKNFDSFARKEIQTWFEQEYGRSTIPALEDSSLKMGDSFKPLKKSNQTTFQADVFGNSLSTTEILFEAKNIRLSLAALIKANQLLAHGGFIKANGGDWSSIARRRSSSPGFVNVEKDVDIKDHRAYYNGAIPIGFSVFSSSIKPAMTNAQLTSLMSGFRSLVSFWADWKPSQWSSITKKINAKYLLAGIDSDDLDQAALPQDGMFALAIGNISSLVANLNTEGSPLFYHCPEGVNAWLSELKECKERTSFASLNTDRTTAILQTKDHADFLFEIAKFYQMTEEIQQSKNSYLSKKRPGAEQEALAELKGAQKDLSDLTVGLSNFLSSVLSKKIGRFATSYHIGERKADFDKISLQTSLSAIRALAYVGDVFRVEVYKDAALNAFKYLDVALYDESLGFFKPESGKPALESRLQALEVLELILPIVKDAKYKVRLEAMQKTWVDRIKKELVN